MYDTTIGSNIKKFRTAAGLTQKQLGERVGKSESCIGNYELGSTEIPSSMLFRIADALKISAHQLIDDNWSSGATSEYDTYLKLRIQGLDERLQVGTILIKNGYTVGQIKQKKTETGKTLDYFLIAKLEPGNAETQKG